MDKRLVIVLFSFVFAAAFLSAVISDSIPVQIQTTDDSGNIVTGTFEFTVNISNSSDCNNVSNVLYSDVRTETTDDRGIVTYTLDNVNLPFDEQYYFCYFRNGILKQSLQSGRTPYSFNSKYLGGYDENFFAPLNKTLAGTFEFNGGWTSGGLTIQNGSIYADTGYFYNLTSLDVSNLAVNGSLFPQTGFDNTFDVGSNTLRWRDLWLGRNADIIGDVGIGTVGQSSKLTIFGSPSVGINLTNGNGAPTALLYGQDPTGGTGILSLYDGSFAESVKINSQGDSYLNGGNVGIGASSPQSKLHLRRTDSLDNIIEVETANGGSARLWLQNTGNNAFYLTANRTSGSTQFENPFANSFEWIANGNQILKLTSGGSLGIGTSSPQNALNVIGDINFTGFIYGDGSQLTGITSGRWNVSGSNFYPESLSYNVGIGTTSPQATLDVNGTVRLGNYPAASMPSCTASNIGALAFDTTNDKPYVCASGSTWKPLDSDYDSDGLTDWFDNNDSEASNGVCAAGSNNGWCYINKSTISAVDTDLVAGNLKYGQNIFGTTGSFDPRYNISGSNPTCNGGHTTVTKYWSSYTCPVDNRDGCTGSVGCTTPVGWDLDGTGVNVRCSASYSAKLGGTGACGTYGYNCYASTGNVWTIVQCQIT